MFRLLSELLPCEKYNQLLKRAHNSPVELKYREKPTRTMFPPFSPLSDGSTRSTDIRAEQHDAGSSKRKFAISCVGRPEANLSVLGADSKMYFYHVVQSY